jgi:flagellar hook-associated protein 1 FlgK
MDFTNGGANDGSISFDLTVDGVTQTVDITFAEASLGAADPAAVTQAELVALINQEANTAFSTVGATYAVADGTAIDLRSGTTGAGSNVSIASYTEANLSGTSTLANGSAVGGSAFGGLQVDLTNIRPGNQVTLDFTDTVASSDQRVTFVHVTDPSALPLSQDVTADPNDLVIGVDLSDPAAVTAALAANGIGMSAAAGAGGALQFIDDGAVGQYDITGLSARLSITALQGGEAGLPMFTDGIEYSGYYSGSFDNGDQKVGFAGRIQVNGALDDDPAALTRMTPTTPVGDTTRAEFLHEQFSSTKFTFDPGTGIGASSRPLQTSLADFGREIVNRTAFDAASAKRADEGQQIVTNGLLARQSADSAVNIDQEMARLTELQSVYAANAQVMTAAREMMDLLLRI